MFPKFLRVSPIVVYKYPVRINDSTIIYEKRPFFLDLKLLNVLKQAIGFSYEIVYPPDGDEHVELMPNGSWTGAYGKLQRGETDLLFGSSDMIEKTNECFRLSYPHSIGEITFITRKHEHVPNTSVFLNPFSMQVWLSVIACVCLAPFIFHFLLRRKHSLLNLFTSTVGSLAGQGMGQIPRRPREYFVLATWILGSALLYYFYSAVLLSFLTFPSLHGIRTIDDLANGIKDGKYQCSMNPGATYDDYFSAINSSSFQVIATHLRENKEKLTDDYTEFLETPHDSTKPAYIGTRQGFLKYKEFYFVSDESFFFTALVFVMRKDFCCGSVVDKVVHHIWGSGIFRHIQDLFRHLIFRYDLQIFGKYWLTPPTESQITMTMLKGPFIFLMVSHSLAFLVFLIELCIGKFKAPGRFINSIVPKIIHC